MRLRLRLPLVGVALPAFVALACSSTTSGTTTRLNPTRSVSGWVPLDASALHPSCGPLLDLATPPAAASSLTRGHCDFGEMINTTSVGEGCTRDGQCASVQEADDLCHRICEDGQCAVGERCQGTSVLVDGESVDTAICLCAGPCSERSRAASSPPSGGLEAWRVETPLPLGLEGHAAVADERHLFVSGGSFRTAVGDSRMVDTIWVADLDSTSGAVGAFREVGKLAAPTSSHAMAILGERLYVVGGANAFDSEFKNTVRSYPISADGSLGAIRDEVTPPSGRGGPTLLADVAGKRLILAGGRTKVDYKLSTLDQISFAEVDAAGVVGEWKTIAGPAAPHFDGNSVAIAAGTLYLFAAGEAQARGRRAIHGIRLADLYAGPSANAFVRSEAWRNVEMDPFEEPIGLVGACDTLLVVGSWGAVGTAPLDSTAHVGTFAPGARFDGQAERGWALATTPSGRVYVLGGTDSSKPVTTPHSTTVHSTRRL